MPNPRSKRSVPLRLLLGALFLPLLVGFGYPDSTGTYAGVSAGGGRYRFTPACSQYTYGADFQEAEVSLQHRIATRPPDPGAGWAERVKPGHVTIGLNGDFLRKEIAILAWKPDPEEDTPEGPAVPPAGQPQVGDRRDALGYAVGARIALDWKWIGAAAGVSALSYSRGERGGDGWDGSKRIPDYLPILGLRLGQENLFYISAEMLGSRPIASGGGLVNFGLGGKWLGNRLWAGFGTVPFENGMAVARISRNVGPVDLSLGLATRAEEPFGSEEFSGSFGIGYRLPWLR